MKLKEFAVFTDAVDATTTFYERLLGTAPTYRAEGIAIFDSEGVQILIHRKYVADEGKLPGENHIAFAVDDVDGKSAQLGSLGIAIEYPARDYEWGRSAYLRDPAGNLIELSAG